MFFLEACELRPETAVGGSIYDAACKAQRKELCGKLDKLEWYAQVLPLLEGHGYKAMKSHATTSFI